MTDEQSSDPTTTADLRPTTVLIVVDDDADRALLREWLDSSDEFTAEVAAPGDGAPFEAAFDVCLFDVDGVRRVADALAAHRESTGTYTPTLLFVPERYGDPEDVIARIDDAGDHIDDVIEAPIRRANLARRLRTLARARRFSTRLERSRDRHRRLVRRLPDAVFVCTDGRVTYANPAAASLLGTDPDAVRGASFLDLVPAVDRTSVARALATAATDGRSEPIETALHRTGARDADGGTVPADAASTRPHDASDGPPSPVPVEMTAIDAGDDDVQVVAHDLRQRREREERLSLCRRAMDAATIGITIADHTADDEQLIYANDEFKRLTGLDDDELLGHNPRMLQTDATDLEPVARLRRAIDGGDEASVVLLNQRSDGRKWYNALTISPIRGADDEVTHYLGFQRDVTEQVSHEQRLSVLDRVLRHNIRNRLNVVLGYTERAEHALAAADSMDGSILVDADELRADIDRIREAATDILDLSDSARRFREDVGADGEPVDATTVVVDVASTLAAAADGADVLVSTPEEPAFVAGAAPLSLVVDELLSNAIEHVDDPSVRVSLTVDEGEVVLRVADDGSGITADSRAPLASGAETPTEHGQGVGLWLVRWTIDAVGGTVRYEEGADGGAVVVARFPVVSVDGAE